jgi:hypothetical protein
VILVLLVVLVELGAFQLSSLAVSVVFQPSVVACVAEASFSITSARAVSASGLGFDFKRLAQVFG